MVVVVTMVPATGRSYDFTFAATAVMVVPAGSVTAPGRAPLVVVPLPSSPESLAPQLMPDGQAVFAARGQEGSWCGGVLGVKIVQIGEVGHVMAPR